MDVDKAFLNAPINEDIWAHVPKGTKLLPREWNQMINGVLLDVGFKPLEGDPCIYKKTVRGIVNGVMNDKQCIIARYVDDLLIGSGWPSG